MDKVTHMIVVQVQVERINMITEKWEAIKEKFHRSRILFVNFLFFFVRHRSAALLGLVINESPWTEIKCQLMVQNVEDGYLGPFVQDRHPSKDPFNTTLAIQTCHRASRDR